MLTFVNNILTFQVKFSDKCVDYTVKDGNKGPTGLDNINRIAGNMYSLNVYDLQNRQFDFMYTYLNLR